MEALHRRGVGERWKVEEIEKLREIERVEPEKLKERTRLKHEKEKVDEFE